MSKIQWLINPDGTPGETWNPVTGCTKVSEGCRNCYAERMHGRFSARPFSEVVCHEERLEIPLRWCKPRTIFICSMGDLFHEDVPDEFINDVFAAIAISSQHRFIVLTKRPQRMFKWFFCSEHLRDARADKVGEACQDTFHVHENDMYETPVDVWPLPNLILGVSVEDQPTADERIPWLLKTPAACRAVSFEPALEMVGYKQVIPKGTLAGVCANCGWGESGIHHNRTAGSNGKIYCPDCRMGAIDWLICGGETGPHARPMHPVIPRSARDQCVAAGVPFFFKQWGEYAPESAQAEKRNIYRNGYSILHVLEDGTTVFRVGAKAAGNLLDGQRWEQLPEVMTCRP